MGIVGGLVSVRLAPDQQAADPHPAAGVLAALGAQAQAGDLGLGAGQRHAAQALGEQAADGVDVLDVELDPGGLLEVLDGQARGDPHVDSSRRSSGRCSAESYSSVISPTISSIRSSMVTSPAVPPYSSTTSAMWLRSRCMSRSRASARLESGTKFAGRMTSPTDAGPPRPRRAAVSPVVDRCGAPGP